MDALTQTSTLIKQVLEGYVLYGRMKRRSFFSNGSTHVKLPSMSISIKIISFFT